jgi:phosphate-selective porin OprO/OprP
VFAHPFQHTGYSWLEGLGIGLAGSADNPNKQALINQAIPICRTTYLNYASTYTRAVPTPTVNNKGTVVSTNVLTPYSAPTSDGDRHRIYPQVYWYAGPFGVMGEYVESSQHLSGTNKAGKAVNIQQNNKAWQVLASYVLTGEDNTFGMVNPIQNFNPFDGKWGAWQLAARWIEMSIDKSTFEVIDPNQASNHATAWTLGINWYLNSNAKISSDFEQVYFKGGAANGGNRPTENVFATRFQLAF